MADEEDLLGSMDELGDDEEEEEGGGSPLMKYLPLVGGVLVVQIIIGYLIGSFFFAPSEEEVAEGEEGEVAAEEVAADLPMIEKEVVWEGLDPIVVNPAGTGGLRFASVHVNLGLTSDAVMLAIDERGLKSRIRDTLINILASKTIDQLDPRYHETLKEEMRVKLNNFLSPEPPPYAVKRVYFQGFVLQ